MPGVSFDGAVANAAYALSKATTVNSSADQLIDIASRWLQLASVIDQHEKESILLPK